MGHLHKGGTWFKKKVKISGFNANTAVDGTDWRTHSNNQGWPSLYNILPSAADAGNYFYLPALGYYNSGHLNDIGDYGYYWSSSALPGSSSGDAFYLEFTNAHVAVYTGHSDHGNRVEPTFE